MAALAEANYGETETRAEAALPAHRGHIYAARCRRKGGRWTGGRPSALGLEEYAPGLRSRHFCGRGFLENPGLLGRKPEAVVAAAFPEPDAAAVAKIAEAMLAAGEICSAAECRPVYARRQIAQTKAMRAAGGGFSSSK